MSPRVLKLKKVKMEIVGEEEVDKEKWMSYSDEPIAYIVPLMDKGHLKEKLWTDTQQTQETRNSVLVSLPVRFCL